MVARYLALAVGFLAAGGAYAQLAPADVFSRSFTPSGGGAETWQAPGSQITKPAGGVLTAQRGWSVPGTPGFGATLTETGLVQTSRGGSIPIVARRLVTPANLFKGARTLAGGPLGIGLLIGMIAWDQWIAQEPQLRVNAAGNGYDRNKVCTVAPCFEYSDTVSGNTMWSQDRMALAAFHLAGFRTANPGFIVEQTGFDLTGGNGYGQVLFRHSPNGSTWTNAVSYFGRRSSAPAGSPDWVPASMDDIAPYLLPRQPPAAYPEQILEKGGTFDAAPAPAPAITGPANLPAESPVIERTDVPVPSPETKTETRVGNPAGLSPNSPTVTKTETGSVPLNVQGKPVTQPTTATTTSTYDPATDRTTDVTVKTYTPIKVETSTVTTNSFTYNQTNVTNNITNTTTTTITNLITNQIIDTKTDVKKPQPEPLPQKEPCGIPGGAPCKIDENGTPTTKELKLDEAAITAQANTNKTTISGTADKGFFGNWGSLFVVPPLVACSPMALPASVGGIGVNPCPVVDGVREFMAWLWALAAFWLCLGWIRESV